MMREIGENGRNGEWWYKWLKWGKIIEGVPFNLDIGRTVLYNCVVWPILFAILIVACVAAFIYAMHME